MNSELPPSVKLDQLSEEDKPTLFEWINNKELVQLNSPFKETSWEDHCRWFDQVRNRKDVRIFAIRVINGNRLIGSCQLLNIDEVSKSAELQIRIGYFTEMGKGLGSEAVKLLVTHGFKEMNLNRIYLHVFEDNTRAIKSYSKNGFVEEGRLQEAVNVGGVFKNVNVMAVLKSDLFKA